MLEICPKCGNYEWNKTVTGNKIHCPKCGATWDFRAMPLFILTGCSGIGKTTTAIQIMRKQVDFVVLDVDVFGCFVNWEDDESCNNCVETVLNLSKDIMQSGKPVLWTMAGCLDRIPQRYNRRFFPEIKCLALVCEDQALRQRMEEGRKITDEKWLVSSREYNQYFKEHTTIGKTTFETFEITNKMPEEVANYVIECVKKGMEKL